MSDPCQHEHDFVALSVAVATQAEWRKSVDGKLDAILAQCQATNGRVRALEDWRNRAAGAASLVGAAAGTLGSILVAVISWILDRR
jgi:hypothetical protein